MELLSPRTLETVLATRGAPAHTHTHTHTHTQSEQSPWFFTGPVFAWKEEASFFCPLILLSSQGMRAPPVSQLYLNEFLFIYLFPTP